MNLEQYIGFKSFSLKSYIQDPNEYIQIIKKNKSPLDEKP